MIRNARSWLAMVATSACFGSKMLEAWECIQRMLILTGGDERMCGVWGGCNKTTRDHPHRRRNSVDNVMSYHDVTLATILRSSLPSST